MPIIASCRCGQRFSAIDELAGKRVSCPSCGQPLSVPSTDVQSSHGGPMGQGGLMQFEQYAPQSTPVSMASNSWQPASFPAYAGGRASDAGLSRGLIIAMCGAGVTVFLVLVAIFVSMFWTGRAATPGDGQPTAETNQGGSPAPQVFFAVPTPEQMAGPPAPVAPQPAPAGPIPGPPTPSAVSPPSGSIAIKLSAATALPQSLPTGTAMGFSVDYEFARGQADPAADYVWVVESAQGQAVKLGVRLESRGTLQQFILEFKPEQGPFRTGIETASGVRLTEMVTFR